MTLGQDLREINERRERWLNRLAKDPKHVTVCINPKDGALWHCHDCVVYECPNNNTPDAWGKTP